MKKTACDIVFLISFCLMIVGLGAAIFVLPQKSFSEKENRALEQMPSPTLSNVTDGSYFESLSAFYKDQFPLRDTFTSLCAISEKSIGKIETNGVIATKDGICIALPEEINADKVQKNLDVISSLSEKKETHLYVPPRTFDVFCDKLPTLYTTNQAEKNAELLDSSTLEDFLEMKQIATEEYYYSTDHHWTTKGAYFAYTQICERLGIEAYREDFFIKETVADDFRGTSAAKSGLPDWMIRKDSIILYRYINDGNITVKNHETGEITNGFYDYEAIEGSDKYRVFLGGNYSHLSISNGKDRPKLLLIKDSFANSVIPFLALHFDIEVIDPRYCPNGYLKAQIEREDIDKILILMGFDTLTTNILN